MEQGEQITIKPVKQGERIRIRPAYQEMIRNLSTALVEDPSSGFRAKWAQAVGNKEWAEKINNYAEYPTLSSLLAAIPFPAKRALYKTLIEELEKTEVEGKRIFASTQDQKLTEILRRLNEPEVQDAIRKAYELPYWVDLDFLGDLVRALKTGAINKEEFLKILKEKGLSNPTVQQELAKIHGDIPKGFFSDRLAEITRERQSPQPLQQSVAEAVSNSIDAILIQQGQERSIGQWGRGIKMLLSYLDHPQDSIIVTTTQNNETWQIEIRKGGDNRLYLSSSKVESSSSSSQSPTEEPKQNGTTLRLKKYEPLTQDFLEQLKQRLKNRFGVVKEVMIKINNEQINKDEIIDVKEDKPIPRDHSLGEVNVTLDPKEIKVEDNGCGMNPDQLLSMFITGAGSKPFVEINDQNRESYLDLIQVFYYEDKTNDKQDKKQSAIEFTRNGETILSLPLSSDKTNLFDRTLSFELGPLLQTSDARESVIINKNFEEAVKRSVDIIIEGKLDPEKKITALNSLIAALTYLGGRKKGEKKTDIFITVSSIISYANKKAKPLINDLSSKGYIFMPNYEEFSHLKLADDKKTVFVDPLLFSFDPEKLNLPGFEQIKPSIFKSSTGQKLFLADFKDATTSPIITYEGGFILDRKVWQKIISLKETNPQDFEVLVEALELRLNPISTSYDPHEEPLTNLQNRLVFKETREEETRRETVEWPNWLINRDQKEKLENILKYIKEIDGNAGPIYAIALSPDGKKVLYGGINGKLMMVDLENQKAPPKEIATVTFINAITLSPDGKKVFYGGGNKKLMMVDLENQEAPPKEIADYGDYINFIALSPDGKKVFYGGDYGKLMMVDLENQEPPPKEIADYGNYINFIALSPDGKKVFYGGGNRKLMMVDLENQEAPPKEIADYGDYIYTIASSPDGKKVLYGGINGKLMMVDLENQEAPPKEIADYGNYIYTIASSPDGKKVFYGGENGKLMMVDLENQEAPPKEIADYGNHIYAIALSPDGKKVFYGGENGKLMMVDLESSNNYQERLTDLINLAEKLYAFSPYPQKIINSLVQFFSDKRDLKIENIDQMVNFLSDERNTRFIQNLFENIPPEINQLNEEEKSRFMSRFLVNLLEASFQISTSENAQELLNTLFDERNNLHLLLDFSLINLQQDKNILEQIKKLISTEENLLQRQIYFSLINGFFFVEKDPIKRQVFLDKLIRINENTAYQRYLKSLASYSEEEIIDLFSKDFLEKETPGRALIEFLKKEGGIALTTYTSLTELTQAWGVSEQNQSVFQREISITEILDQYRIKGRRKWEEVVDAINQTSSTNLNLEPFRQEIIKEVLGQAIEEGIARREMIQNGVDAIKKRQELTEGKIGIHLFKANDEKGECLIEEFTDNGTGVVDWLKFFIPGETTKDASDQGFFGSGAFKIFEGVDRVDILSSTDGKTAYYFRFEWENNNLVIKKSQFIGEFSGEQGTRIRRIKKLNDQDIPEFEAGIISDDYVAFTGLLTNEQINGKTINVSINNETINTQRRKRLSEKFSYNGVEYGEITLVESRLPPTVAHGIGLRMSDLDERYLTYVPQQLKELIKRKKISIVLPKELPLIKDRSRIANEEELFDPLARKIAGMVIKLAAQELILGFKQRNKSGDSYRIWKPPGFPDDWFTNPQYSRLYASEELGYINDIIIKLNKNEVLTPKELSLINQPFDLQSRLAMVIVGLNVNLPDSTTSNLRQERLKVLINTQRQFTSQLQEDNPLLKRLRELIELEASINSQFGISSPETSVSDPTPITTQEYQEQGEKVIQFFLGKIDERDIKEDQLNEIQKQNLKLLRNIASVFNISVFPKANIGAAGYFSDDNKFIIDVETLSSPPAYFVETAFHELAHYKENLSQQHLGPIYTHLFTHQVDGPFGQAYYQVLEEILTKYPPQPTIN